MAHTEEAINPSTNQNEYSSTDFPSSLLEKYKDRKFFISMNWPAFLFGGLWLSYRKMPLFGMLIYPRHYCEPPHSSFRLITSNAL